MAIICIPKIHIEQLRKAVKNGDISIEKLQKGISSERRAILSKYLTPEDAKATNALFEKALVSTQKTAMKNWVWKNFYGGKPLYTEISITQSKAMRDAGLSMKDLRKVSAEKRIDTLKEFVSEKTAISLNQRFEKLQKSGNLANWEERVLGTTKLFENKKLKGAFSRLEVLDDLGLLNPRQVDEFMEDLVSLKLGVDISAKEAQQVSKLTNRVTEAFDLMDNDITHFNKVNVVEYFNARKSLQDFVEGINPAPLLSVFTDVGARGALLFSLRSLTNSFLFQLVPGITRVITKRLASAVALPGDFTKLQRMQNILSGTTLSKTEREFVFKQARMGIKIYRETGFDISRMQNLDDGFHFFGEEFTHINGPTIKEAKTVQEVMGGAVRAHAKIMHGALKYAAGGTDAVFANLHRADTTAMLAKLTSKQEAKLGTLPKGVTETERTKQIMIESYSFNPKSEEAMYIREMGIQDAHRANGTQNEVYGRMAIKTRDALKLGNFHLGKVLIPFLKIPANMLGTGIEAAGVGPILGIQQVIKGLRMTERGAGKGIEVANGLSKIISSVGLLGGSILFTSMLSPDDFVGAYDWRARSENKLTRTKNAGSNYIRVGDQWYSTRWLGPMAIPVSALMYSRQAKARGDNATVGYTAGVLSGIRDFPGLAQVGDLIDNVRRASEANDFGAMTKIVGLDFESQQKWWTSRTLPSFVTYDVLGIFNETKYDAFGRPIPKRGDSAKNVIIMSFIGANLKEDKSNAITKEFDRLNFTQNLPVLTDPSNAREEAGIEKYGEDGYEVRLNRLKRDYANAVSDLITGRSYQRMSDKEKKKAIDKLRTREIINRL